MKGLFNYFNVCGIILNYFTVIQLKVKKKKNYIHGEYSYYSTGYIWATLFLLVSI